MVTTVPVCKHVLPPPPVSSPPSPPGASRSVGGAAGAGRVAAAGPATWSPSCGWRKQRPRHSAPLCPPPGVHTPVCSGPGWPPAAPPAGPSPAAPRPLRPWPRRHRRLLAGPGARPHCPLAALHAAAPLVASGVGTGGWDDWGPRTRSRGCVATGSQSSGGRDPRTCSSTPLDHRRRAAGPVSGPTISPVRLPHWATGRPGRRRVHPRVPLYLLHPKQPILAPTAFSRPPPSRTKTRSSSQAASDPRPHMAGLT